MISNGSMNTVVNWCQPMNSHGRQIGDWVEYAFGVNGANELDAALHAVRMNFGM
jgi:hypothetical protein